MNTKEVGEKSEGVILGILLKAGKVMLQPFGDNQRYDLVMDDDGEFKRIQCKTGRLRNGAVQFDPCSVDYRTRKRKGYQGQVELFGVYCPELDKVYLVPIEDVPVRSAVLRVDPPKNGQKHGVRFAKDYEVQVPDEDSLIISLRPDLPGGVLVTFRGQPLGCLSGLELSVPEGNSTARLSLNRAPGAPPDELFEEALSSMNRGFVRSG